MKKILLDFVSRIAHDPLRTKGLDVLALVALAFLFVNLVACSSGLRRGEANFRRTVTTQDVINYVSEITTPSSSPTDYRDLELTDIINAAKDQANDDPVELGDYLFQNFRENLLAYDDQLENFISDYPTLGDLSDEAGIDSFDELSEAEIQEGFAYLDLLLNENDSEESETSFLKLRSPLARGSSSQLSLRALNDLACAGSGASMGWSGWSISSCLAAGIESAGASCMPAVISFVGSALTFKGSDCLDPPNSEPKCPLSDVRCIPTE